MVKSKTETLTTRLKTLLLKLSEYTIDLKYQKGSEMHTSDALSRLHNLMDTPNNKDVIHQITSSMHICIAQRIYTFIKQKNVTQQK